MGYSIWNDKIVKDEEVIINKEDRGYQLGDGVYEVIKVYDGKLFAPNEHLERFFESAKKIRLQIPYTKEQLHKLLIDLIQANNLKTGHIYFQITRGFAPRVHHFPQDSKPVLTGNTVVMERPFENMEKGVKATFVDDIRWLRCDIKTINLLGAVLAKQEAVEKGCHEAILHRNGTVTEGSSTNVFGIKENVLYTHPANHLILNGITRQIVLQCAKEIQLEIREQPFTTEACYHMDELFITSTGAEITPVIEIDGQKINNGQVGEWTRKLQKQFNKKVESL